MIGDHPLHYAGNTLGLPMDTYQLGCRMLKASRDGEMQIRTLHKRWHPDLLEGLRTAAHTFGPLPGIGTEFWRTAKLHIQIASPPPFVPKTLYVTEEAHSISLKTLLDVIRSEWHIPGRPSYYNILWHQLRIQQIRGSGQDRPQVLLKIPVEFIQATQYQNGEQMTTNKILSCHGTRSF